MLKDLYHCQPSIRDFYRQKMPVLVVTAGRVLHGLPDVAGSNAIPTDGGSGIQ
jgi:hypothetical protein